MVVLRTKSNTKETTGKSDNVHSDHLGNADGRSPYLHPRLLLPAIPSLTAAPEAIAYIRNGRAVNLPEFSDAPLVKVFADQSHLAAICRRIAGTLFQPKIVL